MEVFKFRKKQVEFYALTGEIVGSSKYSETHISSSSGHRTTHIHSNTVTNHEFWLRSDDGVEHDIKFVGIDIPLRPGQKITLISAHGKSPRKDLYSILINHSAQKHWYIHNATELNEKLNVYKATGFPVLMGVAAYIGILFLTHPTSFSMEYFVTSMVDATMIAKIAGGIAGALTLYLFVVQHLRVTAAVKKISEQLEMMIERAYYS